MIGRRSRLEGKSSPEQRAFAAKKLDLDGRAIELAQRSSRITYSGYLEDVLGFQVHRGVNDGESNAPILGPNALVRARPSGGTEIIIDSRNVRRESVVKGAESERNTITGRLESAKTMEELIQIEKDMDAYEAELQIYELNPTERPTHRGED